MQVALKYRTVLQNLNTANVINLGHMLLLLAYRPEFNHSLLPVKLEMNLT